MKKFLSLALAAIMLVAMAIPSVFAANPATPNTSDTIENKPSKLTIHKFDPDKVVKNGDDVNITASENAQAGVAGAKFTAFKVLDYDVATGTYKFTPAFYDAGIELSDVIKVTSDSYSSYGTTAELEKQIAKMQMIAGRYNGIDSNLTNANGAATISGLMPGVYLVMETVVPNGYVVTTQAFLVSLPTFDGATDKWVYEVDALPKNQKIDIDKSIDDAKADTNTGDSTNSYAVGDIVDYTVTVKVPDYGRSTNYPDYQVTDAMFKFDNDPQGFGKTRFNYLDLIFTDTLSNGLDFLRDSLTITVGPDDTELDKGYIGYADKDDDTKKVAVDIDTEIGTDKKTVEYVVNNEDSDYLADYTVKEEGQKVTIDVAWVALNNFQGQTITLKYSAQVNESALAGTAQNNKINVSFVNDPTSKQLGEPVDPPTTYPTEPDPSDPTDPNPTQPTTYPDPDPTDPTRATDSDEDNDVYTYAMDLTKLFDGSKYTDLSDATRQTVSNTDVEFTLKDENDQNVLFIRNTDGSYTVWAGHTYTDNEVTYAVPASAPYATFDEDGNITYRDNYTPTEKGRFKQLTANVTLNADGVLKINGLSDGTYTLTETKTANGYSILTAPLKIVVEEEVVSGKVTANVKAKVGDSYVSANTTGNGGAGVGHFEFSVNNPKAKFFSLPTTGGLGLWLFTVGGGIIMAGAIIFITLLRKKRA